MTDDDPLASRDRALRRLSFWTVAALGGGCALTGFFAVEAASGFTGSSSTSGDTTPTVPSTTVVAGSRGVTPAPTTIAPTQPVPIQPPLGGVRRGAGRTAGRSGGS